MENKYYIYFHINPIKNEIFYVGKGTGYRAYRKTGRNKHWKNVVNKYGYNITIIEDNLSYDIANDREKFYINKIGRMDLNNGTLVNMTDGGDGTNNKSDEVKDKIRRSLIGRKHTQETKDKISKSKLGTKSKFKGIPRTNEVKEKISKKLVGRKLPEFSNEHKERIGKSHIGRKRGPMSQEHKDKISESMKYYKKLNNSNVVLE
jgi:hypothetical protein